MSATGGRTDRRLRLAGRNHPRARVARGTVYDIVLWHVGILTHDDDQLLVGRRFQRTGGG